MVVVARRFAMMIFRVVVVEINLSVFTLSILGAGKAAEKWFPQFIQYSL